MDPDTNTKELNSSSENFRQMEKDMQDLSKTCTSMVVFNNVKGSKITKKDKSATEKDSTFYDIQLKETKELQAVSKFADKKKGDLQNLSNESAEMGFFDCVGDSMISEEDRRWWRFFSLKKSDKAVISLKVGIFQKFYGDFHDAIITETSSGQVNCEEFREKINQLKMKLETEYEAAVIEKKKTSSKLVYNMLQTFISEYEKLNWILRDVENAALSEMLKSAESGLKRALGEIDDLKAQLKDLSDKMTELIKTNTELKDNYGDVCERLKTSEENQATLLEKVTVILECIQNQKPPPT